MIEDDLMDSERTLVGNREREGNLNHNLEVDVFLDVHLMAMFQWNLNGFHSHYEELQILLPLPVIVWFQEAKFKTIESVILKNYTLYRTDYPTDGRACSGVSIGVVDTFYSTPVHIATNLQVVAVRVHREQHVTILNLYITREQDFTLIDLQNLFQQILIRITLFEVVFVQMSAAE